jgi:hypothetical protein
MKSFVGLLVAWAMGFATESLAGDTAALFTPIPGDSHSLLVRHRHVFCSPTMVACSNGFCCHPHCCHTGPPPRSSPCAC